MNKFVGIFGTPETIILGVYIPVEMHLGLVGKEDVVHFVHPIVNKRIEPVTIR